MKKKSLYGALLGATLMALPVLGTTVNAADVTGHWVPTSYVQEGPEYFANSDYDLRAWGNDWTAVEITHPSKDMIHLNVWSRGDIKSQSCNFQMDAKKIGPNTFMGQLEGADILIKYTMGGIHIDPVNEAGKKALYYVCSGGAYAGGFYGREYRAIAKGQDATLAPVKETIKAEHHVKNAQNVKEESPIVEKKTTQQKVVEQVKTVGHKIGATIEKAVKDVKKAL